MKLRSFVAAALVALCAVGYGQYKPEPGELVVKMTVKDRGDLYIRLFTKEAPKTAANFASLVRSGFYNGIRFHRVVPRFVAQAGDPQSKTLPIDDPRLGTQGSGKPVQFETNNLSHRPGTLGMALTAPRSNTGDSQFFINLVDNSRLDGDYVVFGEVVDGMSVVQAIRQGDTITRATVLTAQPAKPNKPAAKPAKKGNQK